jgi:hypothetical protein
MTLQTNSPARALEGARFFGARLGKLAVALRVRVINWCIAADEGDIQNLTSMLDRDVVIVDPREAELVIERMVQKTPNKAEALDRFIRGISRGRTFPWWRTFPSTRRMRPPISRSSPPYWRSARPGRWNTGTATRT